MQPVVDYARARPAVGLRPFVSRYTGYRIVGMPGTHQGVPSGHLTLIVCLSGTVDITSMPDPAQPPGSFDALIGGLHDAPAVITHDGRQHGIHIDLTWHGARALLGLPAGELGGTVVDLRALLGQRAATLADRLASTAGWPARFEVLDAVLGDLARRREHTEAPPRDVVWAWRRIAQSGGRLPVGGLARELGWSRRHFGERFRREVGLAPKSAARVIRFERVCDLLRRPRSPALADAAAECGYYDQAHLAREFRDLAGTTATGWLAEAVTEVELPNIQDKRLLPAAG